MGFKCFFFLELFEWFYFSDFLVFFAWLALDVFSGYEGSLVVVKGFSFFFCGFVRGFCVFVLSKGFPIFGI